FRPGTQKDFTSSKSRARTLSGCPLSGVRTSAAIFCCGALSGPWSLQRRSTAGPSHYWKSRTKFSTKAATPTSKAPFATGRARASPTRNNPAAGQLLVSRDPCTHYREAGRDISSEHTQKRNRRQDIDDGSRHHRVPFCINIGKQLALRHRDGHVFKGQ